MRRKLFFVPLVGLFLAAGFGAASFPAFGDLRVITIQLEGGQRITTTVDVPPNTPVDQIQLPEITAPIEGIEEATPKEKRQVNPTPGTDQTDQNSGDQTPDQSSGKHEHIEQSQGEPEVQPD